MQFWTSQKLKSTTHRVQIPPRQRCVFCPAGSWNSSLFVRWDLICSLWNLYMQVRLILERWLLLDSISLNGFIRPWDELPPLRWCKSGTVESWCMYREFQFEYCYMAILFSDGVSALYYLCFVGSVSWLFFSSLGTFCVYEIYQSLNSRFCHWGSRIKSRTLSHWR